MADNKSREGERSTDIEIPKPPKDAKVNIDLSNAIKDLKAIQREARKTTAALKELDDIKRRTCPSCGLISVEINKLFTNDELISVSKECKDCGWTP